MIQERMYQVNLPWARFAIAVGALELLEGTEWVVQQTNPVARWMMGITIQDIKLWAEQQGGEIEELQDSHARIAAPK